MKKTTALALCLICLITGIFAGYKLNIVKNHKANPVTQIRDPRGYELINPLLECDITKDIIRNGELDNFASAIEKYVEVKIATKELEKIAVYFRELNDGIWFSVGDIDRFIPASLLKVPIMMSILKQSTNNPDLLNRKIMFKKRHASTMPQNILPSERLVVGQTYTVDELLRHMIAYSDNDAYSILNAEVIDQKMLDEVYKEFNFDPEYGENGEITISAPTYAAFFRVLYNATYLSKELSERALGYLVKSEFSDGLLAGVPPDVKVAHKFGERMLADKKLMHMHDCGIVYYHKRPYLLCVMTRGKDINVLKKTIADISAITYNSVNNIQN